MSFAVKTYTGDGSTTDWAVTIDYLSRDHLSVSVDDILTTTVGAEFDFTFISDTHVRIQKISDNSAVPEGTSIKIIRQTPIDTPAVVFGGAVSLSSENLNRSADYLTFALQEATDKNAAFTKLYLGAKDVEPTVDNEGEELQEGALFLNRSDRRAYGYAGGTWVAIDGNGDDITWKYSWHPSNRLDVTETGDDGMVWEKAVDGDGFETPLQSFSIYYEYRLTGRNMKFTVPTEIQLTPWFESVGDYGSPRSIHLADDVSIYDFEVTMRRTRDLARTWTFDVRGAGISDLGVVTQFDPSVTFNIDGAVTPAPDKMVRMKFGVESGALYKEGQLSLERRLITV